MSLRSIAASVKHFYRPRSLYLREGASLRPFTISSTSLVAGTAFMALSMGGLGVAAVQTVQGASLTSFVFESSQSQHAKLQAMQNKMAALQSEVTQIREGAKAHADMLDKRADVLSDIIAGKADAGKLASLETSQVAAPRTAQAQSVRAPLAASEQHQIAVANQAKAILDARVKAAQTKLMNISSFAAANISLVKGGVGGPEDAGSASASAGQNSFRSLFQSWKTLDTINQSIASIPAIKPVVHLTFTSFFGGRGNPFRGGGHENHPGVDIPGSYGTDIYATADGVVDHASWMNGYGNLVEINHGHGILTRYGHLSSFVVHDGDHVHRGQVIAHMGSTGRSTGTHLHYEVRVNGAPVNPMPFLQSGDAMAALKLATSNRPLISGSSPSEAETD
jgi:murein DD-endopeptidase MepM/ murein hydrolase activator NlpD